MIVMEKEIKEKKKQTDSIARKMNEFSKFSKAVSKTIDQKINWKRSPNPNDLMSYL